jgi:carbonic anhydrase
LPVLAITSRRASHTPGLLGRNCIRAVIAADGPDGLLEEMRQSRSEFTHYWRRQAMTATDELLKNAEKHAEGFDKGNLPMPPAKKVAIVACMDARVNPYPILGLELGDAHVIRNAGGVVTDDEIRSLAISQRLLGTEEVILMHHTDCGMLTFNDEDFRRQIQDDTGLKPAWSPEAFDDLEADVRQSIKRIKSSPFIPHKDSIRGFIYEVETGRLREVT